MEDRAPISGRQRGYLAATTGSVLGALLGLGLGRVLASQVKGDPDAGMANLALIPAVIFLFGFGVAIGSAVGCYVALRIGSHRMALATAVFLPVLLVLFIITYLGGLAHVLYETNTQLLTYAAIPLAALVARGLAVRIPT